MQISGSSNFKHYYGSNQRGDGICRNSTKVPRHMVHGTGIVLLDVLVAASHTRRLWNKIEQVDNDALKGKDDDDGSNGHDDDNDDHGGGDGNDGEEKENNGVDDDGSEFCHFMYYFSN